MDTLMDTLTQKVIPRPPVHLPNECIQLILQYLWDDIHTLHALLLVNKTFFSLSIPILYADPFRLINSHRLWNYASRAQRAAYLMRILYESSISKPSQAQLWTMAQEGLEGKDGQGSFLVLDEYHGVDTVSAVSGGMAGPSSSSSSCFASGGMPHNNNNSDSDSDPQFDPCLNPLPPSLTIDYLYHYTRQGQIPKSWKSYELLFPSTQKVNRVQLELAMAKVNQKMILAFYDHFPSRIQVLAMTPSQLRVVLWRSRNKGLDSGPGTGKGGVEDLVNLKRLELDFGASKSMNSRQTAEAATRSRLFLGQTDMILEDETEIPLLFIQEHYRLVSVRLAGVDGQEEHPGQGGSTSENPLQEKRKTENQIPSRLKEIMIRGSHPTWTPTQLLTNIPPMQVVDLSAWNSDVPHLERIPHQRLKSLRINIARRLDFVQVQLEYLKQCRFLEEVWVPSQDNAFRWAIDPTRPIGAFVSESRLRRRTQDTPSLQQQQQQEGIDSVNHPSLPHSTPAIKRIRLYGDHTNLVPSLEDAADAFRDTLQELCGFEDGYGRRDAYLPLALDWPLPQLTTLDLRGRFVYSMDLACLSHCPHLTVVRLHIERSPPPTTTSRTSAVIETPMPELDPAHQNQNHPDNHHRHTAGSVRGLRVFAGMKRLEELQLGGVAWNLDNDALEVLSSSWTADGTDPLTRGLSHTLKYFFITEAHLLNRRGLVQFVKRMQKLEILGLGTMYKFLAESLKQAVREEDRPRPPLAVELNVSDSA